MPPELLAIIDKPWLLALLLGIGACFGMVVERVTENMKKAERRFYWQSRNGGTRSRAGFGPRNQSPTALAADQLRTVMNAAFKPRALLNSPERRLLGVLDKALQTDSPGWRAMGQVSLGEILSSEDKGAYLAINSKRVDLLVVDAECRPLHVFEFQGTGHHMGPAAAARDAVKKEALRRAGIGYAEIVSGDTPAEVKVLVQKLVQQHGAGTAGPSTAPARNNSARGVRPMGIAPPRHMA